MCTVKLRAVNYLGVAGIRRRAPVCAARGGRAARVIVRLKKASRRDAPPRGWAVRDSQVWNRTARRGPRLVAEQRWSRGWSRAEPGIDTLPGKQRQRAAV